MELICIIFPLLISYTIVISDAFPRYLPFTTRQGLSDFPQNRRLRMIMGELHLKKKRSDAKDRILKVKATSNTDICAKNALSGYDDTPATPKFEIREAEEKDLGAASIILADVFSTKLNFLTKRVERMNTYLSLKSRFETFRYAERSGALQCMLVAIANSNDEVVAFCEVDNRPPGGEINPAPRPYISNLAVRDDFRRIGVATTLVTKSEQIVREWGERSLHLCVDQANAAAKAMYQTKCGYAEIPSQRHTNTTGEIILLLGKTL